MERDVARRRLSHRTCEPPLPLSLPWREVAGGGAPEGGGGALGLGDACTSGSLQLQQTNTSPAPPPRHVPQPCFAFSYAIRFPCSALPFNAFPPSRATVSKTKEPKKRYGVCQG